MTSKKMRTCLEDIRRNGYSQKAAYIYIHDICHELGRDALDSCNHCLAVAELMARLAPKGQKDIWYAVGLIHRLPGLWDIGYAEQDRTVFSSIMRKSGYNNDAVNCIEKLGQNPSPETWSKMMTTLIYAITHITESGDILPTALCCERNKGKEKAAMLTCVSCMYVWYKLSSIGDYERYEAVITELREEISEKEAPK